MGCNCAFHVEERARRHAEARAMGPPNYAVTFAGREEPVPVWAYTRGQAVARATAALVAPAATTEAEYVWRRKGGHWRVVWCYR